MSSKDIVQGKIDYHVSNKRKFKDAMIVSFNNEDWERVIDLCVDIKAEEANIGAWLEIQQGVLNEVPKKV